MCFLTKLMQELDGLIRWLRGLPIINDIDEFLFFHILESEIRNKYWHPRAGDVVFDVGAGTGGYAVPACEAGALVFAFEPTTRAAEILRRQRCSIEIIPLLLGARSGVTTFDEGFGITNAIRTDGRGVRREVSTIDEMVRRLGLRRVDWIKIDVEGAEFDVIKGGVDTISTSHPVMIIENHLMVDPDVDKKIEQFVLSLYPYKIDTLYGQHVTDGQTHSIFIP